MNTVGMKNKKIRIINGILVLPSSVIAENLEIENGRIVYIGTDSLLDHPGEIIDAGGNYILPGFIDIHTNGIAGFDLTNGVYDIQSGKFLDDEEEYKNGLKKALSHYVKTGATRVILTSLAAPITQIEQNFGYVNDFKNDESQNPLKDVLEGLYVEGTFMKLDDYRGAHNPEYFNEPSITLFDELQKASGGLIRVVNVVPEWEQPAYQLIHYLSSKNIICAAGHTGATGHQYEQAIQNGLCLAVHFLNGPTGSSSKSFNNGGAVETVLRSDEMCLELIVDGYHVDKSYIRDTIKRKGFDKVIAITDSMFAADMPDLMEFEVFGVKGKVGQNGEYLQVADRENALFGSKLTMDKAFTNLLSWLTTPISGVWNAKHESLDFEEALVKTSILCSANPAKVLGIDGTDNATGSIEIEKCADLVIANISKSNGDYHMTIDTVLSNGRKLV